MYSLYRIKAYRFNKNIVRHQILEDLINYNLANKLDIRTYYSIEEIASLRGRTNQRRFAIKYLLAKGDLDNKEQGIVENISINPQGLKSFYADNYLEIGNRQIGIVWKNGTNITLSIIVAIAAVIALSTNDNYKEELKSIPQVKQQLNNIEGQLDSLKSHISPLHVILDSSLKKQ
jgi:hypothetical protein